MGVTWTVYPEMKVMKTSITNIAWHPTESNCHSAGVNWIAWHPTKKVFLSASNDKQIKKIRVVGRKVRKRQGESFGNV